MHPSISKKILNFFYGKPRWAAPPFQLSSVKKILLIRRNGYGDMICALPLIRNIREALPHVQIDLLASERNEVIVRNLNLVNQIHLYKRGKGLFRNHYLNLPRVLRPIIAEQYDLLIAIKGGFSPLLAVISYATRIPWRLGYVPSKGHDLDYCFNLKVELPVEREHQVESCLRFLDPLGIPRSTCNLSIHVDDNETGVPEFLKASNVETNRFVLINVSSERVESRWTEQGYVTVSQTLFREYGLPVILCGLSRDRHLMENIKKKASDAVFNICEPQNIHVFASLVGECRFLICGDGGPMHIAAAMNKPVLVLFSATDPNIWRPYQVPFTYCQKGRFVSEIPADEVLEKIRTWLPNLGS
jgi:heptosyltransferase-3